jgi:phenylacetate-CoA ligase
MKMSLYASLVRNVLYPLDRCRSGDGAELPYLREFERTQHLGLAELQELQLQRLQRLVEHAYGQCTFYRKRFDDAGFCPGQLRTPGDMSAIPVLEKRNLQEHRDEMVAAHWPRNDLMPNQTGGSTGTPISFFVSRDRWCSRIAATWRHNRWAGLDIGDRSALLWGAARDIPQHSLKNWLRNKLIDRRINLDTGHVTESKLQSFHAALKRFRPKTLVAYANSVALMARYLKSRGLPAYQPHSIIATAEVLEPSTRALIEEVFGCPVFNRYGCREVSVVASECDRHDGLHVMAEGLYVEVVRGDRPARPGELGSVLVTDLLNLAMPLIRYRIGDMAALDHSPCACGRQLPRLQRLEGRVTDFVVGADGRLVSGVFLATYLVAMRPSLGQVQLWQEAPGRVLYKVRPNDKQALGSADLHFLEAETKRYLGHDVRVDHECVAELPREPSGKYLFCRSSAACDFVELHG